MKDKDIDNDFNHIFTEDISEDFLFSLYSYRLFLEVLSINP
jgi:D-glycerate 3-kinase